LDSNRAFDPKVNNRLLLIERSDPGEPYILTEGQDTVAVVGGPWPIATFEPLKFDNLIIDFYQTLIGILRKTKGATIGIEWTAQDIQEIDYLIPVYLDIHTNGMEINGYFYLNKILNYQGGVSSSELFRM
jgi:hypothetical protein